jgi:hypothetical protein
MIHTGMGEGIENPVFEPIAIGKPVTCRYRGQVVPTNNKIGSEMNIVAVGKDEFGPYATAEGWLWVDGRRIYHVKDLMMRIIPGAPDPDGTKKEEEPSSGSDISIQSAGPADQSLLKGLASDLNVPASMLILSDDGQTVKSRTMPLNIYPVTQDETKGRLAVSPGTSRLDMETVKAYGRNLIGYKPWLGEELCGRMCDLFVNRVIVEDPAAFEEIHGKNVIYLANHQIQIESMLFPGLAQVLTDNRMVAIANADHRNGWMGPFNDLFYAYPEIVYPRNVVYFDQNDRASMFTILDNFKKMIADEGISVFLHVEGQLGHRCRKPVKKMSSVFIDLATDLKLPVIPVRFYGGLPVKKMDGTLDFPLGYGKQDYYLGRPIRPETLLAMPYADRRKYVMNAINEVGPPLAEETPCAPNVEFSAAVADWRKKTGVNEVRSVMYNVLKSLENPSETTIRLLEAVDGKNPSGDDPKSLWIIRFKEWLTQQG